MRVLVEGERLSYGHLFNPALKIRVPKAQPGIGTIKPPTYGVKTATSELETHQIQDLSERISELRNLTAGQKLRIQVSIEIGEGGNVPEDVVDKVNTLLGEIKPGWKAQ